MALTQVSYSMISGAPVNAIDFGASPSNPNNAAAINAAFTKAASLGGGVVVLGPGEYICGATILIPNNCSLQGAGQYATTLKLANLSNVNLIESFSGAGNGIGIYDMTLDGNQANNTQGGVYLRGASGARGPTFQLERLTITRFRNCVMPTGIKSSFYISGNDWCVVRDVDIINNDYCQNAFWVSCPDSQFDGIYLGTNGRNAAPNYYNCGMFVTSASNLFTNCYFGGTQQNAQIFFLDSSALVNKFVNCIVDNAGGNGIQFEGGANNNQFIGCKIGNSSYSDGGVYYTIFNTSGNGKGATFIGCEIYSNYATAFAANGYNEPSYMAGNSFFVGCTFSGTFTAGVVSLGTGSTTQLIGCKGYAVTNKPVNLVSGLPAASAILKGTEAFVTDATATTFASIVAGGGANGVPVYCDGTNWRIG